MNQFKFSIDASPENAELIKTVNELILSNITSGKKDSIYLKAIAETDETDETEKQRNRQTVGTDPEVAFKLFSDAAAEAKKAHGVDFLKEVLKANGAKMKQSMPKTLAAVDSDVQDLIMAQWSEGPVKKEDTEDDFGDDDGFGDEADTPIVDPDAVRTALKAYAKTAGRDEAKALMTKHGVTQLSKIEDASPEALAAIMKEVA